ITRNAPILAKPFGFAVDRMWLLGRRPEAVYEAPAGSLVEVELPLGHPELPLGAPVYCSSSQRVKRDYRHDRPKPGLYRMRRAMRVELTMNADSILAVAMDALETDVKVMAELSGPFQPARDPAAMEKAVRTTFDKLGDTSLTLETLKLTRPADVFVPVSRLNQLRRELCDALEDAFAKTQTQRLEQLKAALSEPEKSVTANRGINTPRSRSEIGKAFRWSVKVDRISYLDAFDSEDWADLDEVVIDVARDHTTLLADYLETFGKQRGRDRIRLSLPPLTRKWEERGIVQKIERLCHAGWNKWEVGNLSGWEFLGLDAGATTTGTLDIATDWSVYAINRAAGRQLLKMGVSRFCLSPEDGLENMRSLLAEFGSRTVVIVHQDTPQFLAESCAYANLIGGCPGKAACKFESMEMESSHGERVLALDYHCRTIVLDRGPLCLSRRLSDLAAAGAVHLRADFVYRPYDAATVAQRWRDVRAGRPVPGGHAANFDRGVL
ncbi:MAG: hypothetical protein EBV06_07480, partial [Planctomycetia bacterium]|nr:hypothetical protein [Planctomycetia bacterium]